jgi:hypothetical protein
MARITDRCQSICRACGRLVRTSRRRGAAAQPNVAQVLAILPTGPDRALIEALSYEAGWALTISETPSVTLGTFTIIMYDRELSPHTWGETIRSLTRSSPRPYIILLSRSSDKNLWDELEHVGGSDILRTPLDREATLRTVGRAWSLWHIQQKVRFAATRPVT